MKLRYKDTPEALPLDVDTASRRVKIAIAGIGNIDRDRELIPENAFNRTIADRGPAGSNEIWHLVDHSWSLKSALSKFSELYVQDNHLVGVSTIAKTTLGNDVLEHYQDNNINQHSIGFSVIKSAPIEKTDAAGNVSRYVELQEIALWEGSAVLWGANPNTPTLSVGKGMTATQAISKLTLLEKSLRSGKYTDEFFSLIEGQIRVIKDYILDLEEKANQPAVMATGTVDKVDNTELLKRLNEIAVLSY